ncbi:MAG: hypothetical protein ACTSYD_02575 [Candidatus Heimdallarchaeaceae archaeon]
MVMKIRELKELIKKLEKTTGEAKNSVFIYFRDKHNYSNDLLTMFFGKNLDELSTNEKKQYRKLLRSPMALSNYKHHKVFKIAYSYTVWYNEKWGIVNVYVPTGG